MPDTMTPDEIAKVAEGLMRRSKGAIRAFMAFTVEWQQPSRSTFNWAGAQQAIEQVPDLCEHELRKSGKQEYPRNCYRLTSLGEKVRNHLTEKQNP